MKILQGKSAVNNLRLKVGKNEKSRWQFYVKNFRLKFCVLENIEKEAK